MSIRKESGCKRSPLLKIITTIVMLSVMMLSTACDGSSVPEVKVSTVPSESSSESSYSSDRTYYDNSEPRYDNSTSNYDNSESRHDSSTTNYYNSESHYDNRVSNYDNSEYNTYNSYDYTYEQNEQNNAGDSSETVYDGENYDPVCDEDYEDEWYDDEYYDGCYDEDDECYDEDWYDEDDYCDDDWYDEDDYCDDDWYDEDGDSDDDWYDDDVYSDVGCGEDGNSDLAAGHDYSAEASVRTNVVDFSIGYPIVGATDATVSATVINRSGNTITMAGVTVYDWSGAAIAESYSTYNTDSDLTMEFTMNENLGLVLDRGETYRYRFAVMQDGELFTHDKKIIQTCKPDDTFAIQYNKPVVNDGSVTLAATVYNPTNAHVSTAVIEVQDPYGIPLVNDEIVLDSSESVFPVSINLKADRDDGNAGLEYSYKIHIRYEGKTYSTYWDYFTPRP